MLDLVPMGLANEKSAHQGLSLISPQTLNAFLHNVLILPLAHLAPLHTHNLPLFTRTPPYPHMHSVSKNTNFKPMTLPPVSLQNKAQLCCTLSSGSILQILAAE